jgi:hypothetical protein
MKGKELASIFEQEIKRIADSAAKDEQLTQALTMAKQAAEQADVMKPRFSQRVVMFVIISNCVAFIMLLAAFCYVQREPSALIAAWFAFTGTELLALAGLRHSENKYVTGCSSGQAYNTTGTDQGSDNPV